MFELDISWYQPSSVFFETIRLGLIIGTCLSIPITPGFLISFRESLLERKSGIFCLAGNIFGYFCCLLLLTFGSSPFLKFWYILEPFLFIYALAMILRVSGSWNSVREENYNVDGFSFLRFGWEFPNTIRNELAANPITPKVDFSQSDTVEQKIEKFIDTPQSSLFAIKQSKQNTFKTDRKANFGIWRYQELKTKPLTFWRMIYGHGGLFSIVTHRTRGIDERWKFFWLGFLIVFGNSRIVGPFQNVLYAIQGESLFAPSIFLFSAIISITFFQFFFLFLFRRLLPPLFFGQHTRLSFFIDNLAGSIIFVPLFLQIFTVSPYHEYTFFYYPRVLKNVINDSIVTPLIGEKFANRLFFEKDFDQKIEDGDFSDVVKGGTQTNQATTKDAENSDPLWYFNHVYRPKKKI